MAYQTEQEKLCSTRHYVDYATKLATQHAQLGYDSPTKTPASASNIASSLFSELKVDFCAIFCDNTVTNRCTGLTSQTLFTSKRWFGRAGFPAPAAIKFRVVCCEAVYSGSGNPPGQPWFQGFMVCVSPISPFPFLKFRRLWVAAGTL